MNGEILTAATNDELQAVNRELAALFDAEPAPVVFGADTALRDELVICGILGGKDVGKSTLINALAQMRVSVDEDEVGRGTQRPLAYVHEDSRDAVSYRLHGIDRNAPLDIVTHRADAVRRVVLVDLPDFDSDFLDHRQVVRAVAPLLDRVLWVVTPRKIGDREWVRMFHEVIKDQRNVQCVLNKVDELLADGDAFDGDGKGHHERGARGGPAEAFWRDQHRWVARCVETAGCGTTDDRRFLVSAAYPDADRFLARISVMWDDPEWERYVADRPAVATIANFAAEELNRLRDLVLAPLSQANGQAIKSANRARERQVNVTRIEEHYDLDRTINGLARTCDPQYLREVLGEAVDTEAAIGLTAAVEAKLRPDTAMADELLERRVEAWPLLRLVYWPFGWLSRALGRRVQPARAFRPRGEAGGTLVVRRRPFDPANDPLADAAAWTRRVDLLRSRLIADHAVITGKLGLERRMPQSVELARGFVASATRLPPVLETDFIDDIAQRDGRPSWFARAALWLVLLWFPFAQPILAGLLEILSEDGALRLAHGLYRIVSALSAVHILAGFAVVAGVYVAVVAAMYSRCLRAVRRARADTSNGSVVAEAVDDLVITTLLTPLVEPFNQAHERLLTLRARLVASSRIETSAAIRAASPRSVPQP